MKVGDYIKPVRNNGGHSYVIGRKYQLVYSSGAASWVCRDPETGTQGNNIREDEMIIWALSKADIEKRNKEIEAEIHKNQMMLDYLTEEGKTEVDNNEFFAWYMVKLMESNDPAKKEKISKLLNTMTNNISIDILSQH